MTGSDAVTRFLVVVPPGELPGADQADRTSLAAFLKEDHPGALLEILTEFAVRGVNLTTIQSRPTGDGLGSYFFFIDCEGHIDDTRVGEAMVGLRRVCAEVRFFGSYPRSDGGRTQVRVGTSNQEFAEALAWLGRLRFGRALFSGGYTPTPRPPDLCSHRPSIRLRWEGPTNHWDPPLLAGSLEAALAGSLRLARTEAVSLSGGKLTPGSFIPLPGLERPRAR